MGQLEFLTLPTILYSLSIFTLLYTVTLTIQRLYLSPIAHFPGPKLAALTLWYEFYYDVILPGQYTFHLTKLHARYGPIIRINPWELHVNDPEFIDELYAGSTKTRDKWKFSSQRLGFEESAFGTNAHPLHRERRAAINPYFSKASVRRLQPVIDERVQLMIERLREAKDNGKVLSALNAFAAFTNDVVMEYSFARSEDRLSHPEFDHSYHDILLAAGEHGNLTQHYPFIVPLISTLPDWLSMKLIPALAIFNGEKKAITAQIHALHASPKADDPSAEHPTIFHSILSSSLSASQKTVPRLSQEAQVLVGAGTTTTAWTLTIAIYHLLSNPTVLRTLKSELAPLPDSTPLTTLEALPYLTGVIQESLRLSYGVSHRLQRIAPNETLNFTDRSTGKTWEIPRGTPVGMTSVHIHHDESIFPDSHAFLPERWIKNPRLDKYLVTFSKGSRRCVGLELAYAELRILLAAIFKRFGSGEVKGSEGNLQLFETDDRDVLIAEDQFVPRTWRGSQGVRILVTQ